MWPRNTDPTVSAGGAARPDTSSAAPLDIPSRRAKAPATHDAVIAHSSIDIDIFASRLGRKLVVRFILAGIIPLIIFAVPLYWQTNAILTNSARGTLISYTKLAKGQIFMALDAARTRLEQEKEKGTVTNLMRDSEGIYPFRRLISLDRNLHPMDGSTAPWENVDEDRRELLMNGKVILTRPYFLTDAATVAMMIRMPSGLYAAELEPEALWNVTQAGNYGPQDALAVLDAHGRILASSSDDLAPGTSLFSGTLPQASRATGESNLSMMGDAVWGFSDFWLEGAFGGERWGLVALRSREAVLELPYVLFKSLLVLSMVALCVIVIFSFREVRQLLRPIVTLAGATRAVAQGDWQRRMSSLRDDELGDLMRDFDDMTHTLVETHDDRVRLTREAMVGRLAAMVAHQINTPLAAIKAKLGLARQKPTSTTAADLDVITGQVNRIATIVRALLGFARLRAVSGSRAGVHETLSNVVTLFRPSFENRGILFTVNLAESRRPAAVTPDDLQEVVVNLLENAREALTGIGVAHDADADASVTRPTPEVRLSTHEEGTYVIITVEDNGPGIVGDSMRIFDAFITTKTSGTGLGLAITRRICEAAGGSVAARNQPGGGAAFTVMLPCQEEGES